MIPKKVNSRHILIFLLVAVVSFLANNITSFFIVDSLIEGYMLIASTQAIVEENMPFMWRRDILLSKNHHLSVNEIK